MPVRASDVMRRDVVTVSPDATVAQAVKRMVDHAVSALPVCDAAGVLVGILSEGDLLRPFGQRIAERREQWLNLLAEGEKLSPAFIEYLRADHHKVAAHMTRDVVTAQPDATLAQIADLLFEKRLKRVPIVKDGVVVGVVSRGDIIRAVADHPDDFV